MSYSEEFRKKHVPAMDLQTNSWTHPPSPKEVLELLDQLELAEQHLSVTEEQRNRWKDEAAKYGEAFKAAARVLRAIDFTPAHLGKDSAQETGMWLSWARGVIRVWNENKEKLLEHLNN